MAKRKIKGSRAVILGGMGFIGRNLAAALLKKGVRVVICDLKVGRKEIKKASSIKNLELKKVDILDRKSIKKALGGKVDIIFNLAGHSGPKASLDYPFLDLNVNVLGALNVLEEARAKRDVVVVFVGSRLEYGSPKKIPVNENVDVAANTFYGVNKFTAGSYHILYHRLYGIKTVVLRGANPYGPHLYNPNPSYNIVNFFIDMALKDKVIPLYKNVGSQLKDYIYISDFCEAMIAAGSNSVGYGQVFNLGSGKGIRFETAAKQIVNVVGKGKVRIVPQPAESKKVEAGDFVSDTTKIKKMLKWRPRVGFVDGIKKTIGWENNNALLIKIFKI